MLHTVCIRFRNISAGCLIWTGVMVFAAAPASAIDPLGILTAQMDANIAQAEELEREGVRRAKERIKELAAWIDWWDIVKKVAQDKQIDLSKNIAQRQKNAALLVKTINGLTTQPKQSRHVPNFGWYNRETAAALTASLAREAQKLKQAISDGKDNWHIIIAGWITGGHIDGKIAGLQDQIAAIEQGIADGTFNFHGPFGWTTIGHYRALVASYTDARNKTMKTIADGNYRLTIPGVGAVTKNELEKKLDGVEASIEKLKQAGKIGELNIHRPAVGWVTRKKLDKAIDDGEKSFQIMKKTVADGLLKVHIAGAGGGWWSKDALDKKAATIDKAMTDISAAIRKGDYKAQVWGGWQSLNHLKAKIENYEKRLKDPNLTQIQRNQLAESIQAAQKGIKEWHELSALDLAIKGLEKSKFLAWSALILKYAKPDFEHRELERDERLYHLTSFKNELELKLKPLETRRDAYLDGLKWFSTDN